MPDPLRPGDPTRMGRYGLTARLGEGGQGVVYMGTAPNGAPVAVKVLRADLAGDDEAQARFVREVSVAERVAAFCTAQVIETGVDAHRPFIVSEFINGATLAEVVERDGPRGGSALHRLAVGTVTALVAIHQAEIVHRDFKPSNVILGEDGPRVIDFGIARALDRTSTLTSMAIGTPAYMTPEQLAGEPASTATDLFAWACTIVYAATGKPPFGTDSLPAVFNRIMNHEPDLSGIEEPLRGLVAQCLAKNAAARPTASEALLRLLGHVPSTAGPTAESTAILQVGTATATSAYTDPGRLPIPAAGPPPGALAGSPAGPVPDAVTGPASGPVAGPAPTAVAGPGPVVAPGPMPGPMPGHVPDPGVAARSPLPAAVPYTRPPDWSGPARPGGGPAAPAMPYVPPPNWSAPAPPWPGDTGRIEGSPATGSGARRNRMPIVLAVLAGVAVIAGAAFLAPKLLGGDQPPSPTATADSTTEPSTEPSAGRTSAGPTPLPSPTGTVDLPGTSLVLYENADDPIRLTSYYANKRKDLYLRGKKNFAKTTKYFEALVENGGARAIGVDVKYTTAGYATVSLIDRATGKSSKVTTVKAPLYVWAPAWSPDHSKILLSVLKSEGGNKVSGAGFVIVDVAAKTAKFVQIKSGDVGKWSYFWRGDGRAVGTWAIKGDLERIRFYGLNGKVMTTLTGVGTPVEVSGDDVSPSGELFLTRCAKKAKEICVWTTSGTARARVPFDSERLVGWYDDQHIAGWRKTGARYEIVVVGFSGTVVRRLGTAPAAAYKDVILRYTREAR